MYKELFTEAEVRAIVKSRSRFEHTLLRRTAKNEDFVRYAQYEMDLERLRQKRLKRQKSISSKNGIDVEPGRKSISDYAGPKRIRNIFQRAATRFRDIGIWIQYIEYSMSQKSPKLTSKLFGE